MGQQQEGTPGSELRLVDPTAREVPIPYGGGSEYLCPNCERTIPNRKQIRLAKPPKYENQLLDLFKCPFCKFIFAWKSTATVIRQ